MVTSLLLATATLATALAAPAAPAALQQEPTVRVSTNKGDVVKTGDRVRVYVETVEDGYLVVLHAEPDGRLRFLYPLDPFRDNFVRGGRKFEIRGRGDREAIRIFHDGGFGTIYAAYFRDPFEYQDFIFEDHWDYRALETYRLDDERDPEAELTAVTQHVAGQAFFEYDLVHYGVGSAVASGGGGGATRVSVGVGYGYGGYGYGYSPSFGFGISFGWGYPYHHRYSHLYNCGPYWYDAWTCGSLYRTAYWYSPYPYYYGYGYYRPYSYSTPHYYSSYGSRYGSYGYGLGSSGHIYAGRYAFKPNQGSSGGVGLRTRTFAGRTETGNRRNVASTPVSGRSVATSTRLRQASQSATDVERRVQPSGWGISNGRRTVTPARAEPTRGEGQVGSSRRTVERTAVRSTTELERQARNRSVSIARRSTTGRSSTASRTVDGSRRTTSPNQASRSSTRQDVDRSRVTRRSATQRTPARATGGRSTSRAQGRSTTTPRRTTIGSSRVRTNNARATSQRSTRSTRSGSVSRPSVSRSAPSRGGGARPAARAAPRSNPVRRPAPARRRPT